MFKINVKCFLTHILCGIIPAIALCGAIVFETHRIEQRINVFGKAVLNEIESSNSNLVRFLSWIPLLGSRFPDSSFIMEDTTVSMEWWKKFFIWSNYLKACERLEEALEGLTEFEDGVEKFSKSLVGKLTGATEFSDAEQLKKFNIYLTESVIYSCVVLYGLITAYLALRNNDKDPNEEGTDKKETNKKECQEKEAVRDKTKAEIKNSDQCTPEEVTTKDPEVEEDLPKGLYRVAKNSSLYEFYLDPKERLFLKNKASRIENVCEKYDVYTYIPLEKDPYSVCVLEGETERVKMVYYEYLLMLGDFIKE